MEKLQSTESVHILSTLLSFIPVLLFAVFLRFFLDSFLSILATGLSSLLIGENPGSNLGPETGYPD
jgi:hypothetical protein